MTARGAMDDGNQLVQPTVPDITECVGCGRRLAAPRGGAASDGSRCVRCMLLHPPMLRRSLYASLVVGTLLTAINQGNLLLSGEFPAALLWKVPLTYSVPFCVATWGALGNALRRA